MVARHQSQSRAVNSFLVIVPYQRPKRIDGASLWETTPVDSLLERKPFGSDARGSELHWRVH